jgi:hypothetical protein
VSQGVAAGEGIKFAGLLVDSFSSDGVFTDPPGFLKAAVDVTRTALRLGRSFFRRRFPWRLSCLGSAPWRVAFVSMEAIPSPPGMVAECKRGTTSTGTTGLIVALQS